MESLAIKILEKAIQVSPYLADQECNHEFLICQVYFLIDHVESNMKSCKFF